jgi:MFS family permease
VSTLHAGLLVAPQGIGAMLTMPLAGFLVDRIPVGRIVPFGMVLIAIAMLGLTQIQADTSYTVLIGLLFVMGLGMGGTMMPLFTTALNSLRHHEVARGSTLLNITQQIASSVGVAVISVVLTSKLQAAPLAQPAIAAQHDPSVADRLGPVAIARGLEQAAQAFASTYWVAFVLVLLTFVPVAMLPRKRIEAAPPLEEAAPLVMH